MRGRRAVVLTCLLTTAMVPGAAADPPPGTFSPDGVYLYDMAHFSRVWEREFTWNFGAADQWEILHECASTAAAQGHRLNHLQCWETYLVGAQWIEDAEPTGAALDIEVLEIDFSLQSYTIYDNVDGCCGNENKNADGKVTVTYYPTDSSGVTVSFECQAQDKASGKCEKTWTLPSALQSNGLHRFSVVFEDMDCCFGFGSDPLDISIFVGVTSPTIGYSPELDQWWADYDVLLDPVALHACWEIDAGDPCELTGQYDATGDHDDAGLTVSMEPTPA